ncbi:RluA family pseudouridine synthase [Luteibaculum oceani]|uniref:RluA family pseudouridine synthase n=1 Tax=Luteibaculum oceani TaxID=1294296 RepID=A0A5C6UUI8_9FLAO|nr:RluA family pseudouridine synthase [Luteibaculum oceani]TXC76987.1 RluA family pseudouridine synthase [Luteibaculum oceani]
MLGKKGELFHKLEFNEEEIEIPQKFTFPFNYSPHPLSVLAVDQLKTFLASENDIPYDFGIGVNSMGFGKMFGVLVVRNPDNEIGFLAAFSGQLGAQSRHHNFVPPIFDMYEQDSYFHNGMKAVSAITTEIEHLEGASEISIAKQELESVKQEAELDLKRLKKEIKAAKKERDQKRIELKNQTPEIAKRIEEELAKASKEQHFTLKKAKKYYEYKIKEAEEHLIKAKAELQAKKEERTNLSMHLQAWLFNQFDFLNAKGERRNVGDIFSETAFKIPPSGAGDCAAPKLLQFAFENGYTPLCMAEFWWGKSPASEIRQHGNYYPSCKGKCEPILGHMLAGLKVDENPMKQTDDTEVDLPILFEDEDILVVDKPAEFLAVPGKIERDSVYNRVKSWYPDLDTPWIIHRLDMSTSGLMVLAKNKKAHEFIQKQFIQRTMDKSYQALVVGKVAEDEGEINLPLVGNVTDRPRQKVCFETGKSARTLWQVLERNKNITRLALKPVTGRTHQLRVHCAHNDGLGHPIKGDDLYGKRGERLYLHAHTISFVHPTSRELVNFMAPVPF